MATAYGLPVLVALVPQQAFLFTRRGGGEKFLHTFWNGASAAREGMENYAFLLLQLEAELSLLSLLNSACYLPCYLDL